jgi:hypothetical protein
MAVNTINQKLVNNVSYECSVSHGLKKYIGGGSSSSFPPQEVNPPLSAGAARFSPKPVRVPSHSDWEVRQFPAYNSRNGVQGDSRSFFSHSPPSSSANHPGLFGGRKTMTDFSSNSYSHSSSSAELSPMNSPRPVYPSLYPQHQFPSSLLSTYSHSSSASSTSVSPFPEFSLSSGPTAAMMLGTGMEVGMNSYYKEELPVPSSHELPSSFGLFF